MWILLLHENTPEKHCGDAVGSTANSDHQPAKAIGYYHAQQKKIGSTAKSTKDTKAALSYRQPKIDNPVFEVGHSKIGSKNELFG